MYNPDEFFKAERKCHAYSNEKNWLGEIGVCNGTKEREPCSCGGDEQKCDFYIEKRAITHKRQTNADRIRAMSDEKLAEYLSTMQAHAYYHGMYHGKMSDETEWLEWLQQEVEE